MFCEGLIPAPSKMLQAGSDIIVSEVLAKVKKLIHGKRDKYPLHVRAYNNAKERFGPPGKSSNLHEIDYDLAGLPSSLQKVFKSKKDVLTLYFDWDAKFIKAENKLGVYYDEAEVIVINPRRVLKFLRSDPSDLIFFIHDIISDVKHELMHMVQHRAIKNLDPKQTDRGNEYFSSNVEFSPQIDSAVHDFTTMLKLTKMDFGKAFKIYVGQDKPAFMTGIQPSPFFLSLKNKDINKYQKAIKEFYKALYENMA